MEEAKSGFRRDMRIPDQPIQLQFRSVRRRFKGRYRRAVGPIEVTALLNVMMLVGMFCFLRRDLWMQPGIRIIAGCRISDGIPYGARPDAGPWRPDFL